MANVREYCEIWCTSKHNAVTELLFLALAFWGFMLDPAPSPRLGCLLLLRIQDLWHGVQLEPDSTEKFVVSPSHHFESSTDLLS
jgi:hypothetical protein